MNHLRVRGGHRFALVPHLIVAVQLLVGCKSESNIDRQTSSSMDSADPVAASAFANWTECNTADCILTMERTPCVSDADCPGGFRCLGNWRRVPRRTCALPCSQGQDCPVPLVCERTHDARETGDPTRRGVCTAAGLPDFMLGPDGGVLLD